jgi:hypothetical protein
LYSAIQSGTRFLASEAQSHRIMSQVLLVPPQRATPQCPFLHEHEDERFLGITRADPVAALRFIPLFGRESWQVLKERHGFGAAESWSGCSVP